MSETAPQMIFQKNWVTPFEFDMNLHKLKGINIIWNYADMFRADLVDFERAIPSILREVSKNMLKRQADRSLSYYKNDSFKLKLEPYQALALEIYIRGILYVMPYGYERHSAALLANEINQKLS